MCKRPTIFAAIDARFHCDFTKTDFIRQITRQIQNDQRAHGTNILFSSEIAAIISNMLEFAAIIARQSPRDLQAVYTSDFGFQLDHGDYRARIALQNLLV